MTQSAPLVDRTQLLRNRRRARHLGGDFFLHEEASFEIKDRVQMVNKAFKSTAIVTSFPELWQEWFPDATVIEDDEVLSLKEGAHDLVIHAMALHWANDPVGQLIQCNRALQPDGLMIAAFFGGQTLQELRASLAEAEISVSGGLSPRVLPMGELRDLGGLLQRASFALPVADKTIKNVTYTGLKTLMLDLRAMGETAALGARSRKFSRTALFDRASKIYETNFAQNGRINATFELVFLTGWAPDANQPKPLMPGSAKTRLADALQTEEFKLPNATNPA